MKKPIVIIGMGEMGELFARGFLKMGHPVHPVLRGGSLADVFREVPDPALVLLAIGEDDLDPVMRTLPTAWRPRLGLLQNELLPGDWERHGITDPTVIVVWFDKKKGRPFMDVLPTPVCGAEAFLILQALQAVEVPCHVISAGELLYELVRKNLYILTINIAGLRLPLGGTVSELWEHQRERAALVAGEVLDVQEWLTQTPLPRARLMAGMLEGFAGDPHHICTGRSALKRLQRTLAVAREAGIPVPTLQAIARDVMGRPD